MTLDKQSSRRRTNSIRLARWLGISALLALVGGFVAFVFWPRPQGDVSSIESWLNSNGYEIFRPFRDNVPPGTVLRIEKYGQSVVATAEMVDLDAPEEANAADISWDVQSDLESLGKSSLLSPMIIGDLQEAGASEARVSISQIKIREIPLLRLSDAARNNAALKRLVNDRDKRLVLVDRVLEAGSIRFEFFTRDRAKLDLKRSQKSRLSFGQNFHLTAEGTLISTVPLLIGYHANALGTQALSLGQGPGLGVRLTPLSGDDLAQRREITATPESGYQIFALTIGLGNYTAALPGAPDSAMRVAERLLPFARSQGGRVNAFVSVPDDATPVTKSAILKVVNDFVTDSKRGIDPKKPKLVILYYFGHGLSEGIGRTAFMEPEDYVRRSNETVLDSSDRLVDLGDVLSALKPLSDNVVALFDSCREHGTEDKELIQAWKALGQNEGNMGDILHVLQFSSGTIGPPVVFFGSVDGTEAPPVTVAWSNNQVGPLSARINALLDDVERRANKLTPSEFIDQMEVAVPSDSLDESGTTVRGYTALRDDFRRELPQQVLFEASSNP